MKVYHFLEDVERHMVKIFGPEVSYRPILGPEMLVARNPEADFGMNWNRVNICGRPMFA